MVGGVTLLPEILGQTDRVGAKSPIFSRYSLVAPQRSSNKKYSLGQQYEQMNNVRRT